MWGCNKLFGFFGMGGFHLGGPMFHLLFWAALILFIVWVVRKTTSQENHGSDTNNQQNQTLR